MEKHINQQTLLDLIKMEQVMIIYLIGIFVGVFFVAYAPYARKKKDSDMDWNHYYTAVFLMSFVIAVFAMAAVYLANPLPPDTAFEIAFLQGLILGSSSEAIVAEFAKRFYPPPEPKPDA